MSDWKKVRLSDVADVKLSNVDKKTNVGERLVRLCNYTDVYKNTFINSYKSKDFMIASCNDNEYEKFVLKKGQVAITKDSEKRDDIGISTYIAESFDDVVLGYHLSLITPIDDKLDGRFLNYWFNTNQAKIYFENNAGGSGQRCTLPIDIIKGVPIKLPDLPTQQKIASVLSALDDKIELNNRINAELEAMAKTLYDYWFVQFDFPNSPPLEGWQNSKNFDGVVGYKSSGGKMVYNETLKREIPEGWEVKNLFEVCNVQYGFPFSTEHFNEIGNGIPVIRIRDIVENSVSNYSTEKSVDSKYEILKGDLLVGMDGNFHINYWTKNNCYLNQRVVKLTEKELPNIYLRYQIEPYIKAREASVSRTTVGHLSDKDLKAINVLVPPKEIKLKIKNIYSDVLNKIITNKEQNQELSALRDWLLPMLMNGQVKVG
ncbi:restriction endonuclease subunit S [Amniculibacterium sp. G2-70]|uniref:restriction endonuclease subunit S n=1 Tax=Amniculibacterium sp. G2-70 TaxID=2767188 RepID=UPI0016549529|nr:restriction endonuclease subunit S [Amniculibacterium sp. G2-70]